MITAIETLLTDLLPLDFVKGRLLDEEVKLCEISHISVDESLRSNAFYTKNKKEIRCYGCGKLGHKRNRCRYGKLKQLQESAQMADDQFDEDKDAVVFITYQIINDASNKYECMEVDNNRLVWFTRFGLYGSSN